jgi:hypothetical protein
MLILLYLQFLLYLQLANHAMTSWRLPQKPVESAHFAEISANDKPNSNNVSNPMTTLKKEYARALRSGKQGARFLE